MQAGVHIDDKDHEPVAREGHQKHDHDDGEEEEVQGRVREEAQEDKVRDESLVSCPGHCSCSGRWDLEAGGLHLVPW